MNLATVINHQELVTIQPASLGYILGIAFATLVAIVIIAAMDYYQSDRA